MNLTSKQFDNIELEHIFFVRDMLLRRQTDAAKERMIAASYTAWQMQTSCKLSFGDYLKKLGLIESEKISKDEKQELIDRARKTAERIMKMDKK